MATVVASEGPSGQKLRNVMGQLFQVHKSVLSLQQEALSASSGSFIAGEREAINVTLEALSSIIGFFEKLNEFTHLKSLVLDDFLIMTELDSLVEPLREIKVSAAQPWKKGRLPAGISNVMRRAAKTLSSNFSAIPVNAHGLAESIRDPEVRKSATRFTEPYVDQVTASKVLAQAQRARDETLTVLDSAKRAAGEVGATEQAIHYKNFADSEKKTANMLRVAVVLILVMMAGVATVTLNLPGSSSFGLAELSKLAIVVPLAVLAAYLGRESSRHRATANWSQELAMQLLTFDAFAAPIDEATRIQLRAKLAAQVFGGSTQPTADSERGPSVAADVIKLLETLGSFMVKSETKAASNKEDSEK